MYPQVALKKGKESSLLRRHPWIFSGAIATNFNAFLDGECVRVVSHTGEYLGTGHFQHGSIAVRILTFDEEALDQKFWDKKVQSMVSLRVNLGLLNPEGICRLCHGEGDEIPGLIMDFYNGVVVLQCHSVGLLNHVNAIRSALKKTLGNNFVALYHKSSETLPKRQNIENGFLHGDCPTPHIAHEDGIKYAIDWISGQKTGFYIDQRDNRALLGKMASGKTVLNAFCYSGGFSLQALKNKAKLVYSLDASAKAIALTEKNLALNNLHDNHVSVVGDAMDFLKDLPEPFDIIILDPPAFAKHLDKKHKAIQGYKRLNAHALRQIKSGGILFTFSCSQVVDKALFKHTIVAAAIESGRKVKILHQLHQPADHPVGAFHPEGEYLKGLVLYVE